MKRFAVVLGVVLLLTTISLGCVLAYDLMPETMGNTREWVMGASALTGIATVIVVGIGTVYILDDL